MIAENTTKMGSIEGFRSGRRKTQSDSGAVQSDALDAKDRRAENPKHVEHLGGLFEGLKVYPACHTL
jgi:hypothetical protein